jgi:predicted DNA-binding protein (UPF0278 family)
MAVDQTELKQQIGIVSAHTEMVPQVSTWCVSNTESANQLLAAYASDLQILKRFVTEIKLVLIKGRRIAKHSIDRSRFKGTDFLF